MPGYGEVKGIAVTSLSPGSAAGRAGLREGDVITAVNNAPIDTVDDMVSALEAAASVPAALSVYRNGAAIYIVVR